MRTNPKKLCDIGVKKNSEQQGVLWTCTQLSLWLIYDQWQTFYVINIKLGIKSSL